MRTTPLVESLSLFLFFDPDWYTTTHLLGMLTLFGRQPSGLSTLEELLEVVSEV
jgi:hypothetical protein